MHICTNYIIIFSVQIITPNGCVLNDDCADHETCINRQCRDPCSCGTNAVCYVKNHKPICSCQKGYQGHPDVACFEIECQRDSECMLDTACSNGKCVNPCLISESCGTNAECFVRNHEAFCRCQSGFKGNAQHTCHIIGCYSNSDCPSDHACVNSQCVNPCLRDNPCSTRANCIVQNHLPICKCQNQLSGNPYVGCQSRPQPECREDGDCPSLTACINNKCQNPCTAIEPCTAPAECRVLPNYSVRSMVCVCPSGYISSGSGTCKPIIINADCRRDSDCTPEKACINALCKDPCACGTNAVCNIRDHKPICSCLPGYDGNPEAHCVKGNILIFTVTHFNL